MNSFISGFFKKSAAGIAFLFLLLNSSRAADRYWVGNGSSTSWNNTANWSTSSGGAGGASVPGSSDKAIYNGSGTGQCVIDATVNIAGMDVQSGFTDTIKQGSYAITIGTSNAVFSAGVFWGGSASITLNGTFTLSGATFRSTSGTLTSANTFTKSSGTFTHNSGTVKFTATSTITGSATYHVLQFDATSAAKTFTIASGTTLTCESSLTLSGNNKITLNTGDIHVKGNVDVTSTYNGGAGSATVTINGTGSQSMNFSTTAYYAWLPNVVINKSSGTLTLVGLIGVAGNWTYTAGTVDAGTSTIAFIDTKTISGTISLYNVYFTATASTTITIPGGTSLTVLNDFTIGGGNYQLGFGGNIYVKKDIYISNTLAASGGGGSAIHITGTGDQTIYGTTVTDGYRLTTVQINKPSGTLYLTNNINIAGNWTWLAGNFDAGTSTVHFIGTKTVTGSLTFNKVTFRHYGASVTATIASGTTLTVNSDLTIDATYSMTLNGGNIHAKGHIFTQNSGATVSGIGATTTITINGTSDQNFNGQTSGGAYGYPLIVINKSSGTLYLKNTITVYGGWTYTAGTVTAESTNYVNFYSNTSAVSISGSMTFQYLSFYFLGNNPNFNIASGTTLTTNGYVQFAYNPIVNGGDIHAKGDIYITSSSAGGYGSTILTVNGTGNQNIYGASGAYGRLLNTVVNKSSGTLTLNNYIRIYESWTYTAGTINAGSSTVEFPESSTVTGSHTLNNVIFKSVSTGAITVASGTTLTVNGTLELAGTANLTLNTGTVDAKGNILISNTATGGGGTATLRINGSAWQELRGNTTSQKGMLPNVVVNKTLGSTLSLAGYIPVQGTYTYTAGVVDMKDATLIIGAGGGNPETITPVTLSYSVSHNSTTTSADGGIDLAVSGGKSPYTYTWSTGSATEDIEAIAAGTYTLAVTDNIGNRIEGYAFVGVYNQTYTVTIQPDMLKGKDAAIFLKDVADNYGNQNNGSITELRSQRSTTSGNWFKGRNLLQFDLSSIPSNATVSDAKLYLYGVNHLQNSGQDNTSYLQKITAAWQEKSVTWNNQPASDATGQVTLASTTSQYTDYTLGVTSHVQDWVSGTSSNYGWMLKLNSTQEGTNGYAQLVFGSSDYTVDVNDRPKLEIAFTLSFPNNARNWVQEETYDGTGALVSASKQYTDALGRATQSQVKSVADNNAVASQTIYDAWGRPAISTLPAPIGSATLLYKTNFISKSGSEYNYSNFDSYGAVSKLNNPDAVDNSTAGTVGHYYSDNSSDGLVATTGYPYTRSDDLGRTATAGDEYKMGSGKESKAWEMVSGSELDKIFNWQKWYKVSIDANDKLVNTPITAISGNNRFEIKAVKTLSKDADGKEVVSYEADGVLIASCHSGLSDACTNMTGITNYMLFNGTRTTDFHLPGSKKTTMSLPQPTRSVGTIGIGTGSYSYKITDLENNYVLKEYPTTGYDFKVNTDRTVTFYNTYTVTTTSNVLRVAINYTQGFLDSAVANSWVVDDAKVTYALDYSRWTVNYYDLAGRLRKSVTPKGINCSDPGVISMSTTYDYSPLGQLIASKSPDEGKKQITYDNEGKLRFSQNEVQAAADKFSYTHYDKHGRPVESGESSTTASGVYFVNYYGAGSVPGVCETCVNSNSIINNVGNAGLTANSNAEQSYIAYYKLATSDEIPSGYTYKSSYTQKYLLGQVSKTWNDNVKSWYSYDHLGRSTFVVQQLVDADYTGINTTTDSQVKTLEYTYNLNTGTVTEQLYQKNVTGEKLKHTFSYDGSLRLTQVDVAVGSGSSETYAKYFYYLSGALKRTEYLKGTDKLQGLDYVYTVNGQLKAINHPSLDEAKDPGQDGKSGAPNAGFAKDVFGLTLDYHQSDYIRTSSNVLSSSDGSNPGFYNGRIHAQRWKMRATTNGVNNGADYLDYGGPNQAQLIGGTTEEHMNRYAYDDEYKLSTAVFGTFNNSVPTFTASTANNYKEFGPTTGIEYDVNGNITRLKRNGYSGSIGLLMDDLTYTYTSNTNKLASIIDGATSTYPNDFDAATSKTFSYNTLGQMTATQAESVTDITYRPSGKTKVVTFSSGNTATYDYNERGIKCKTKYYNGTNNKFTWYITDAGGNILAVYDYDQAETPTPTFRLQEQPVYGSGRIGTYDRVSSLMEWEVKDHLGNIRTVFKAIGTGTVQITARTDYYSFGGPLPGRSYNLGTYRFNYQGQETAVNQNWENFELRMYNYDLGRFCSPDPAGQFYSPYTGMGNNPISGVDPTGGFANFNADGSFFMHGRADALYYDQYRSEWLQNEFYTNSNWNYLVNQIREKYSSLLGYQVGNAFLGGATTELYELANMFGRSMEGGGTGGGLSRGGWIDASNPNNNMDNGLLGSGADILMERGYGGINANGSARSMAQDYKDIARANYAWAETKQARYDNIKNAIKNGDSPQLKRKGLIFDTYTYGGVKLRETKKKEAPGTGWGMALPGLGGIYITDVTDKNLLHHELGHWLQYLDVGLFSYYSNYALPSLQNQIYENKRWNEPAYMAAMKLHSNFWVEVDANVRIHNAGYNFQYNNDYDRLGYPTGTTPPLFSQGLVFYPYRKR